MATATKDNGFKIREFTPVEKPGRYDAEVAALIDADASNGKQNLIDIAVPTTEKSDRGRYAGQEVDAVPKYIRYFQYSAKHAGKTARLESQQDQGDGMTVLSFYLTDLVTRIPKGDQPTELDVPEAV